MPFTSSRTQQGAALIVSLIMLLTLTILGVSSLSNSGLESRMAHNYQLSNYVFHGAESAIEDVLDVSNVDNPTYVEADDLMITAMNAGINDTSTTSTYNPDPDKYLGAAAIATNSAVVYQGQNTCPGTSFDEIICHQYEIATTASIADTGATDTHRLGVVRAAPGNNI